ncbi:oligoendopeptidase F [Paenibacillus sp. WLX1005]|uniref:oligoendopeptidase F n=1 Tax=Paenibacillus sp. WLX1005 TaxID=3243766 RepID=UPI003983FCA3
MSKTLSRSEVPIPATWNVNDLYATEQDWNDALAEIEQQTKQIQQFRGRLGESAATLLQCLEQQTVLELALSKAYSYASLQQSADGSDSANIARSAKAGDLYSRVQAAITWIDSEILDLPQDVIANFRQQEAGLQPYERILQQLDETRPHRLAPETENALAALGEVTGAPYRIYVRSKLTDMTFDDCMDSEGNIIPVSFRLYENAYEVSADTTLRRNAFASFTKTLKQYRNTFAETYATEVKKQIVLSGLRKYTSVTDMLLQPQQVNVDMYHNIHNVLLKQLSPHMQRYAALKKRKLGLDKLYFCDLKAPLDPSYNPSVSYEEASDIIQQALAPMGENYSTIIRDAFAGRWIDYADNDGKSTGAFCSPVYGEHPYILMAWSDNMRNAFTLAHELGHAAHFALAAEHQPFSNYWCSTYFVEAPSTMNELLLADHLLQGSDDKRLRSWVIQQLLSTYYHNFITHLLEAELQRQVYAAAEQGQALTADWLSTTKGQILQSFWGETLELDEGATLTWMRQPHYYMGLYPYTYAAGLTASTAAMQLIRQDGQPAIDRWLKALQAGGSQDPLELMKLAGVDMSGPEPIQSAADYVGSLIAELESLYE